MVRDPEELHDALLTLGLAPPREEWQAWFETLVRTHRAASLRVGDAAFWVATERSRTALLVHADARIDPMVPEVDQPTPDRFRRGNDGSAARWLDSSGPLRESDLAALLAVPAERVAAGLARLEGEGQVLRGRFTAPARDEGPRSSGATGACWPASIG